MRRESRKWKSLTSPFPSSLCSTLQEKEKYRDGKRCKRRLFLTLSSPSTPLSLTHTHTHTLCAIVAQGVTFSAAHLLSFEFEELTQARRYYLFHSYFLSRVRRAPPPRCVVVNGHKSAGPSGASVIFIARPELRRWSRGEGGAARERERKVFSLPHPLSFHPFGTFLSRTTVFLQQGFVVEIC